MRLLTDPAFLAATLGEIYDCVLDPRRWEVVLPRLGELIGARRAFLGIATAGGGLPSMAVAHGFPSVERMIQYGPVNPGIPFGLVYPPDRAFVFLRDLGEEAVRASRFYREYLQPIGDRDGIAFVLTREGDSFGHWALVTQEDRPPITDAEAAGYELIAPHIRRAVEISHVLGTQRVKADTYRAALGQLDSPVLLIDGRRRLLHANPRAEAVLAAGRLLLLREGRQLRGATDVAEAVLRRVAEDALEGGAGGFEATLTGTDGDEWLFFAACLDAEGDTLLGQAERTVLLVLRSPREDTRNPVAIAARVFGLTPTQAAVLSFLAQGHAPDAIADILGLSVTTVRSHLAELFGRTGTSRQAELVARTLSLTSPLRDGRSG